MSRKSFHTNDNNKVQNAKSFDALTFTDDFMFCKVLTQNPDLCKRLLEIILQMRIHHIEILNSQQQIEITTDGRGVRLDVYAEDDENTVYDIEMQVVPQDSLPKRTRYYQGMIDLNLIERGAKFGELKKSYIIFICVFDPFGKRRHVYTFENTCREVPTLRLGDESVKVFLNAYGEDSNVSEEMTAFLKLLTGTQTEHPITKRIADEVEKVKLHNEWRMEYMTLLMRDNEMKEQGIEEGKRLGIEAEEVKFAILSKKLLSDNRKDDLLRATYDIEFKKKLYEEYKISQ